ncbi:MAG: hypothetical protein KIT19_11450 [Phycisphaeraceae bacterium]|nr:hypothetical protein [Phycisphaeraceae bacterium]
MPDGVSQSSAITIANDETLKALIQSAQRRVVFLGPAVTKTVAEALANVWKRLGKDQVSVVLDVDPEVYRLGYGDQEALTTLEEVGQHLGTMLHRQAGIRIGLVIVDDQTLVYSPTPRLIEAGPKKESQPNAVLLGPPPAKVAAELGQGPEGVKAQRIGLDKAELEKIAEVKTELKENPPLSFDIAQKVRVFNAYFEFVDLSLESVLIQKRSVKLPPDLAKFTTDEELNKAIKTSVGLIGDHPELSGERMKAYCDAIRKRYLVVLRGYKPVVLRKNKAAFEERIEHLRERVEAFGQKQEQELQKAIDATRDRLTVQILPRIVKTPPTRWLRYIGSKPSEADIRDMLARELAGVLGSAADIVGKMRVKLLFMGVTFESLTDPEFIKVAQKALPGLKRFHDEYDAAKGKDKGGLFGGKP